MRTSDWAWLSCFYAILRCCRDGLVDPLAWLPPCVGPNLLAAEAETRAQVTEVVHHAERRRRIDPAPPGGGACTGLSTSARASSPRAGWLSFRIATESALTYETVIS
jgi:hypothetical protein